MKMVMNKTEIKKLSKNELHYRGRVFQMIRMNSIKSQGSI